MNKFKTSYIDEYDVGDGHKVQLWQKIYPWHIIRNSPTTINKGAPGQENLHLPHVSNYLMHIGGSHAKCKMVTNFSLSNFTRWGLFKICWKYNGLFIVIKL